MANKIQYVRGFALALLLGAVVTVSGLVSQFARADTFSWLQGDITGRVVESANGSSNKCITQKVRIGHSLGPEADVCIYQANGWRYGMYSKQFTGSAGNYTERSFVIGFGSDRAMYKVTGLSDSESPIYVADSNNLVYKSFVPSSIWGFKMQIIKNLPSKLEKISNGGVPATTSYRVREGAFEDLMKNESGNPVMSRAVAVSDNGEWMVAELRPGGLVRINMKTLDKLWFSKYSPNYGQGLDPTMEFAVSDDGKYVATVGLNTQSSLSELNGNCGRVVTVFQELWLGSGLSSQDINACPTRDLYSVINQTRGGDYKYAHNPAFNSDAGELTMYTYPYNRPGVPYEEKWITLRAAGYTPLQLDYLALGDSYSSGEGDTEVNEQGGKFYRSFTNNDAIPSSGVPEERCHLSTRSYPYRLAFDMNLIGGPSKKWETIACSGATTWDVKEQSTLEYAGQGARLENFDKNQLKSVALNEFIPGRHKQIEFVRRYKPKVITLTIGGNDIGFADKLANCATFPVTCDIVGDRRSALASEILGQYDNLSSLYEELYRASDYSSKIYVLGYPHFINGSSDASCGWNIAGLNAEEREMIVNSITYLNNVIKSASAKAGVKYIDIENSINGHRLCDNSEEYVTGVVDPLNLSSNRQESFHPNAKGNSVIVRGIGEALNLSVINLLEYDTCPHSTSNQCKDESATKENISIPSYFQQLESKNAQNKSMTLFEQRVNGIMNFKLDAYSLAKGSVAKLVGRSSPVNLGEFETNKDGGLIGSVEIPDSMSPGYHTLLLQGRSYSGELIEYEQTIFVKSSNPNDVDGDGIIDVFDKCPFITPVNIDEDADGIDDACDSEIGVSADVYRIREGDTTRTHDNILERHDSLIIERNVSVARTLGLGGDNDVDHDGWVTIAVTKDELNSASFASFWIDNKVPHVSFRTQERGCVQYKPANLSTVTNDSERTLIKEAEDTKTCRRVSVDADLDYDGQSDNLQPLYRTRNGNKSQGEDPSKIYLERSTRAAEAQLGRSDYAPADPQRGLMDNIDHRYSWSRIAVTENLFRFPLGAYEKATFRDEKLYVVAKNFIHQCYIYRPDSLATIRRSTQMIQSLRFDWWSTLLMQQGSLCIEKLIK